MLKTLSAAALALAVLLPAAHAADKEPTKQQGKMASCNKDAGEKKLTGDERKKFMSGCLKG